jgi:hypothetical protein
MATTTPTPSVRVRYHRTGTEPSVRDYAVQTQDRPRGRWVTAGMVSRFGAGTWAALGTDAHAWTAYRTTRGHAVSDMLAGRTWATR